MASLIFRNVAVLPGNGEHILPNQDVVIKENLIDSISPTDPQRPVDEGETVIDGGGRTLMPGLIDAHWHAAMVAGHMQVAMTADSNYVMLLAGREATATLMRGFTTVRDCGGPAFGLKRAIDEGVVVGPRIYPAGAQITQTAGHGDYRFIHEVPREPAAGLTHLERVGLSIIADGPDAVLRAAREQLMLGASHLKVMAGGGVSSLYDPIDVTQYTEAELRAAVEAAENWGTYVAVHAYNSRSTQQALRMGVRCIEHGQLIDEATVEMLVEKQAWWSIQPFLADEDANPKQGASRIKQQEVAVGTARAIEWALQYGAKLAWGTDILFSAEGGVKQAKLLLKMLQWLSPNEVLTMATSTNAELLQLSGPRNPYPGELGRVAEGALADVLLVDGDPVANIDLLLDPDANLKVIVKDGVIYKNTLA